IAIFAFALFAAAWLVHLIVWHVSLPKRHTLALLVVLIGSLPLVLVAARFVPILTDWRPNGWLQCAHVALFHVAMSLAYVVCYSAIEERSPTMTMLSSVAAANGNGRTPEELVSAVARVVSIDGRLAAMTRDGMITRD